MLLRSMNRSLQEKKVKAGLTNMATGGLGDLLKLWNEGYFSKQGLFVHMELSESAMKNPNQSKTFRKPTLMFSNPEDRERKREERKFVIVVTKLDEDGQPSEALNEFAGKEETTPVEIGSSGEPEFSVAELPGDEAMDPVEMPADSVEVEKTMDPPSGFIEMDSDNTHLLEKMHIGDSGGQNGNFPESDLTPKPLIFTRGSTNEFDKETR